MSRNSQLKRKQNRKHLPKKTTMVPGPVIRARLARPRVPVIYLNGSAAQSSGGTDVKRD